MTQKGKKEKGKREVELSPRHRTGVITKIVKLEYIAEVRCWCGKNITIDSTKSLTENECPECGSPYKLIDPEWTPEECDKYMKLKGLKP